MNTHYSSERGINLEKINYYLFLKQVFLSHTISTFLHLRFSQIYYPFERTGLFVYRYFNYAFNKVMAMAITIVIYKKVFINKIWCHIGSKFSPPIYISKGKIALKYYIRALWITVLLMVIQRKFFQLEMEIK